MDRGANLILLHSGIIIIATVVPIRLTSIGGYLRIQSKKLSCFINSFSHMLTSPKSEYIIQLRTSYKYNW